MLLQVGQPDMRGRRPRARHRPRFHEVCPQSPYPSPSLTRAPQHVEQRHQRVVAARILPRDGRAALHEGHVGHDRHRARDARGHGAGLRPRAARAPPDARRARRRRRVQGGREEGKGVRGESAAVTLRALSSVEGGAYIRRVGYTTRVMGVTGYRDYFVQGIKIKSLVKGQLA